MAGKSRPSKDHHWWPVALQSYWADNQHDVWWVKPDGQLDKKRFHNRKVGYKIRGHTLFSGDPHWQSEFESEFDIDNDIHDVVRSIQNLKPLGQTPAEFIELLRLRLQRKELTLRQLSRFHHIEEPLNRKLTLLILSLLIRSPGNRSKYENYPTMIGLSTNEEVGKINMAQSYRLAKKLCETGAVTNRFFAILHSPMKRFICGDGYLDWMTGGLSASRIDGKALIPITPNICIYLSTPMAMRTDRNCAAITAAPWMVDWINEITQIYSRDRLFFRGRPPTLSEHFRKQVFLEHGYRKDILLDQLDEISGRRHSMFAVVPNIFT